MAVYYPECRVNLSVVFDGFGGRDKPQVIPDIIPLSATVHLNSYKEADTWEVTFDARRFPFSPELINAGAIEIFLYQRQDLTVEPFHPPATPVPATIGLNTFEGITGIFDYALAEKNKADEHKSQLVITGLIDSCTLSHTDSGGIVSMSGRDYTALLSERQWDPEKSGKRGRIPDGDLEAVVQQLVDEAVNSDTIGRTLQVSFIDFEVAPLVKDVSKTITQKKVKIKSPPLSKSKSKKPRGIAVKADSTYWDVIYKLCLGYGFICFVQGFDVIIAKPHVLQANQESLWGYWRVAYGRNLESLEVERKLSKQAVPQIRVTCWSKSRNATIEGRYPSDKENQKVTGVGTKKEEFLTTSVTGIDDPVELVNIAHARHHAQARGEGTIKFTTPHLKDLHEYDMLAMRSGDAVEIIWDAFNAEVMLNPNIGREQKVTELLSRGYSIDVASLVADQYEKLDYFRQPFYVKNVVYNWESESGISIEVEAQNFVNAESFKTRAQASKAKPT